ncbi:MAG TPA: lanthionine synthetase LanC family protein [Thermoanaerobaculia bacterium]|jgi:hypothetical protein|nr:lanthionine synthetase LanC family protein [Thermoanaerobaculia bacterium]
MTADSLTGQARWQPLLSGEPAAMALAVVGEIAAELRAARPAPPEGLDAADAALWQAALGTGDAGRALLFAYLDLHLNATAGSAGGEGRGDNGGPPGADPADQPGCDHAVTAIDLLDRAVDSLADAPLHRGLFAGLPGVTWVSEHLRGRVFDQDAADGDAADEAVLAWLRRSHWAGDHDLVGGLAGLGVYALERLPRPGAARALDLVVERLAGAAQRTAGGAAWLTAAERLPEALRQTRPDDCRDLGAAHGAAGVVAFLGAAIAAGLAANRALPLLEEAMRQLLSYRQPDSELAQFPSFVAPGVEVRRGRLAWCYGDLGIAATVAVAAQGARRTDWRGTAHEIARAAARRPPAASGVVDASLCHGAAGVAHLFNRLYQESGDPELGEAARRWLHQALAFRRPGRGIGGFRTWEAQADGSGSWYDDAGFLAGAAGTGLALLAAVSPVEPAWDRALLLSLRPEGEARHPR